MFDKYKKGKKPDSESTEWKAIKEVVDAQYRATNQEREKMTRYLRQWQGDIWDNQAIKEADLEDEYRSRAHINLIFSTIEAIAPMLTDSRPITSIIPRQPHMEKLAWKYNKGLEYAWDALEMQMEIYKLVLYGMIMKKGVLKIYYDPDKTFGGDLCIENIDPRDFGIAPGYDDIWKSPYCWVRSPKSLAWIRSHFPDAENITAETTIFDDRKKAYKYGEATDATLSASFATVYEVWMKDEKTMEEVTEDYTTIENYKEEGETKEREVTKNRKTGKEQQKYPNGKFVYFTKEKYLGTNACDFDHKLPPYVDFNDYVDPTSFLGLGEVDQIEGLNKEINLQFQAIMAQARRTNNPNYMVDIDQQVDPEELKSTFHKGGQHYSYSSSFGSKGPPITPIEFAKMNKDVYTVFDMIPTAVKEVSGVRDISKGASEKKERQSASEIAILAESANTRTRQKVRNLEWTLKRVGYLLVRLMQQYYTEPRTIYTVDSENNVNYEILGNSLAQAIETIGPSQKLRNKAAGADNVRRDMEPGEAEEYEQGMADLDKLYETFDSEKKHDPVLFDFDLVIQTNSTLPMDKQSLANLMLRLFQMKAVDAEAVLEILQIPGKDKILGRIDKQRKAAMKAKAGRPPQGGPR